MSKLAYGKSGGKGLSYSRRLTAHLCPRKFQLENILGLGKEEQSVTFSYGHCVAAGVQHLIANPNNLDFALVAAFAEWKVGLHEEEPAAHKSFHQAVFFIKKFHAIVNNPATNFLRNFEVAMFPDAEGNWKPAIELTFCINCPEGYTYEGHIDLVLKEKNSDNYLVLELKTTKFVNIDEASYKNSDQGLGYSLVVDEIAKNLDSSGSYSVMYLVAKSTRHEFEPFIFTKTRDMRLDFINSLIVDIEILELYKEIDFYPMHGENCYNFFNQCQFFGRCNMSKETLLEFAGKDEGVFAELPSFDFIFDLEEVRQNQLNLIDVT